MTTRRITDFPDGAEDAPATAVVVQDGRTKTFDLKSAAGRAVGAEAGNVPELAANGAVAPAQGGTGQSATPTANKVFGFDASAQPALLDLPGGSPSIADRSITADKLADDAVITRTIADGAVGSDQIKADAVDTTQIAPDAITDAEIAAGAVGTPELAPYSVTTGKLANNAVTNSALNDRAVRYANLDYHGGEAQDGQVLSATTSGGVQVLTWTNKGDASVGDGTITHPKLAANAVEADNIAAGAVGTAAIADGAVTEPKLAIHGTPTGGQVVGWDATNSRMEWKDDGGGGGGGVPADGSITTAKLADDAVTAAKIDNGAITNAAVASNAAIDLSKLNITGTPTTGQVIKRTAAGYAWADDSGLASIPDGGITTQKLADDAVDSAKIKDGSIVDANVSATADVAITKIKIGGTQADGKFLAASSATEASWVDAPSTTPANNSITTAMIQDDAITAAKLGNSAVVNAAVADGAITNAKVSATAAIAASKLASIPYSKLTGTPTIPTQLPPTDDSITPAKFDSTNDGADGQIPVINSGGTFTFEDKPTGGGTPADGSITEPKLAAFNTPTDDQVLAWDATNSRLYWKVDATANVGSIPDGSITLPKLNAGSGTAAGQVLLATSATTMDFVDPANPGAFSTLDWGSTTSVAKISSISSENTYLVQQASNPALYAIVNNSFNASTLDLSTSPIPELLVAPNFNAVAVSQVKVLNSTFYGGLFGRSGGSNYVYISRTSLGQAYFWRDGSAWTEISTANSNTNLLKTRDNIPVDGRWYPMDPDTLPDGIDFALGKSNNTDGLVIVELAWGSGFGTYGIDYTRYTTAVFTPSFRVGDGAVTTAKIADGAISSAKMGANSVGSTALASNAVVEAKINNRAVTRLKIGVGAVGTGEIADNAVNAGKIAAGAVGSSEIAAGAVGSSEIAAGAVGSSEIAAGAVGSSELANNAVNAGKIAAGAVGTTELANNAVNGDKIASDAVGASQIASSAVGNSELATNAVSTSRLQDDSVTQAKIADDAVGIDQLNTTNAGTSGQALTRNATGGLTFADAGGSNLNISGTQASGKVIIATSASAMTWDDPQNPSTPTPGFGGVFTRPALSRFASNGTLLSGQEGVTATINNFFNAAAQQISNSSQVLVAGGNATSSARISVPQGETFLAGMLVRGAIRYYYILYTRVSGDTITRVYRRTNGGLFFVLSDSEYLTTIAALPTDGFWYPFTTGGVRYIARHTSNQGLALTLDAGISVFNARYLRLVRPLSFVADGSVDSSKMADNAVISSKIASNAVVRAKIGADAVDGTKIADDAIGLEHINASGQAAGNFLRINSAGTGLEFDAGGSSGSGVRYLRGNAAGTGLEWAPRNVDSYLIGTTTRHQLSGTCTSWRRFPDFPLADVSNIHPINEWVIYDGFAAIPSWDDLAGWRITAFQLRARLEQDGSLDTFRYCVDSPNLILEVPQPPHTTGSNPPSGFKSAFSGSTSFDFSNNNYLRIRYNATLRRLLGVLIERPTT